MYIEDALIHFSHIKFNSSENEKRRKPFLPFFENFDRDFGTFGIEIAKIGFQIRNRRPRVSYMQILVNLAVFFFSLK